MFPSCLIQVVAETVLSKERHHTRRATYWLSSYLCLMTVLCLGNLKGPQFIAVDVRGPSAAVLQAWSVGCVWEQRQ